MLKQLLKRLPGLRGLASELHILCTELEQSHAREACSQVGYERLDSHFSRRQVVQDTAAIGSYPAPA